ncbi:hypothetical protein U0070_002322 [Myodes glareolus]|uniref:Uncharacterized protein n=1 Tax=Myodes glareolus TaxID=447135 RepID=A0AAW0IAW0_MYOGA
MRNHAVRFQLIEQKADPPEEMRSDGACNASIDSCINDTIQAHAEQIDVAMHLFVLILADQSSQLLILILDYLDGILQRTHLHLLTKVNADSPENDSTGMEWNWTEVTMEKTKLGKTTRLTLGSSYMDWWKCFKWWFSSLRHAYQLYRSRSISWDVSYLAYDPNNEMAMRTGVVLPLMKLLGSVEFQTLTPMLKAMRPLFLEQMSRLKLWAGKEKARMHYYAQAHMQWSKGDHERKVLQSPFTEICLSFKLSCHRDVKQLIRKSTKIIPDYSCKAIVFRMTTSNSNRKINRHRAH